MYCRVCWLSSYNVIAELVVIVCWLRRSLPLDNVVKQTNGSEKSQNLYCFNIRSTSKHCINYIPREFWIGLCLRQQCRKFNCKTFAKTSTFCQRSCILKTSPLHLQHTLNVNKVSFDYNCRIEQTVKCS